MKVHFNRVHVSISKFLSYAMLSCFHYYHTLFLVFHPLLLSMFKDGIFCQSQHYCFCNHIVGYIFTLSKASYLLFLMTIYLGMSREYYFCANSALVLPNFKLCLKLYLLLHLNPWLHHQFLAAVIGSRHPIIGLFWTLGI